MRSATTSGSTTRAATSASAARRGRELLEAQFARWQNIDVQMAIRSAGVLGDAEEIAVLFEAHVGDPLTALR